MFKRLHERYRYSLILLKELVITDFKLRYQGSALGYVWTVMRPLFLFVILYFVFVYFLRIGGDIPHWPVSLLLGIVLWNFFTEVTNSGVSAIVGRGDVIRKINFPKYVIVLSSTVSALINLLINLAVIGVFMAINGVGLSWSALLAPIFMVEILLFALGIAFILSTVYVKLRDINYVWEVIIQGLFYASAIIYPITMVLDQSPAMAKLLLLSPITQAIQDVRQALIYDGTPTLTSVTQNWYYMLIPIAIVIITLVFGALLFKKNSPSFAEEV